MTQFKVRAAGEEEFKTVVCAPDTAFEVNTVKEGLLFTGTFHVFERDGYPTLFIPVDNTGEFEKLGVEQGKKYDIKFD